MWFEVNPTQVLSDVSCKNNGVEIFCFTLFSFPVLLLINVTPWSTNIKVWIYFWVLSVFAAWLVSTPTSCSKQLRSSAQSGKGLIPGTRWLVGDARWCSDAVSLLSTRSLAIKQTRVNFLQLPVPESYRRIQRSCPLWWSGVNNSWATQWILRFPTAHYTMPW